MDIDQDLCTGDGLCVEIAPDVFYMDDDGLAYVHCPPNVACGNGGGCKTSSPPVHKMGREDGLVDVPEHLLEDTIEAADECPGECIFIEVIEDE